LVSSYTVNDDETKAVIKHVFEQEKYLLDPHGAVAWLALEKYQAMNNDPKGIFIETAHPVKFYDVVEPVINQPVPIPEIVQIQLGKEKKSIKIAADSNLVKEFLRRM
jgi:threonine synthase